jgi:hypothetical protein
MDWIGITLITGSLGSLLYAIFSGGVVFPWYSGHVLAPLIIGIIGLASFALHEAYIAGKYVKPDPLFPLRIFGTLTSKIGYFIVLEHAIIFSAIAYYYPLYVSVLWSCRRSTL